MKLFAAFLIVGTFLALPNAFASWLPEDAVIDYKSLPVGPSNVSETQFREIITEIQNTYAPLASAHNGRLSIRGDWRNEQLNAGASQLFGNWFVQITGGIARRPELTPDGFALILCHEVGHHMGGYAFAPADSPFSGIWAANEGQADYFSSQVCARKIWGPDTEINAGFRETLSREKRAYCDRIWDSEPEQNLCYRVLAATESMTLTMATILKKDPPKFETPDPSTVNETVNSHPAVQCRMDTVFQGALCKAMFNDQVIPGKTANGGPHSQNAEREAAATSCMAYSNYENGLRPSCWFKSKL